VTPRLLLVDNYDSFTFNLYQALAAVLDTPPIVVANDAHYASVMTLEFDGVVISPGPGRPSVSRDFGICSRLIEDLEIPILGVCLGHQGIGEAFGASVDYAPEPMHGRASLITHHGDVLFTNIPTPFEAVRYHSLLLTNLPPELEVIAETDDGLVMGLRHRERPIWGVQFHPESIGTPSGSQLLSNFIRYVAADAAARDPRPIRVRHGSQQEPEFEAHHWSTHIERLKGWCDPESLFIERFGSSETAFWLDSTRIDDGLARYSFMGDATGPHAESLTYDLVSRMISHRTPTGETTVRTGFFEYFERQLERSQAPSLDADTPFQGGWVGYLGYELKGECGGSRRHDSALPDAALILCDRCIVFDHHRHEMYAVTAGPDEPLDLSWLGELQEVCDTLDQPTRLGPKEINRFRLARPASRYLKDIQQCLNLIRDGETYEVCLTTYLIGEPVAEPLNVYRHLRHENAVPFGAYLRFGDLHLASISPERFVQVTSSGCVEAKPIKGTAARGKTPSEDDIARGALAASEKDRAENLMIVDLLRNDLGRECEIGSVHVPTLMAVESYGVHQLVSTVRGKLASDSAPIRLLRAAFPGGSMTGAPKRRTMEIIDQLEGESRGPYAGALGYFSLDGALDMSIVIRTAVMTPEETRIGVGGAIVSLSEPRAELEEIILKGSTVTAAFITDRLPES